MQNIKIEYKAKRSDNNEWVFGYYVVTPKNEHRIYLQPFPEATSNTYFVVVPETVGQYICMKDSLGNKIYNGDVIEFDKGTIGTISWAEEKISYCIIWKYRGRKIHKSLSWLKDRKIIIVIGNRYDNIIHTIDSNNIKSQQSEIESWGGC